MAHPDSSNPHATPLVPNPIGGGEFMSRTYSDDEFTSILDLPDGDEWVGTAPIARLVACEMVTVNRRLIALADDEDLEIYDPKANDGDGAIVEPDAAALNPAPKRALAFRRRPADPETAPDTPENGFTHAQDSLVLLLKEQPHAPDGAAPEGGDPDADGKGGEFTDL